MNKPIVPLTYEQLDQWIESLQPLLAAENFAAVVGILRGGAPLALMVSHATGAPVAFLRYERATREVRWDSALPLPEPGSKVLLCEDIAGRGFTLTDSIAFLREHGLAVRTLTGAYDDLSRLRPDYSIDASGYFALFPWERQAYTDRYRADWARDGAHEGALMAGDHEYAVYAIDLDGILLPDIPLTRYDEDLDAALTERDALLPFDKFPGIDLQHTRAIITGRPEMDRARTQLWLERFGFGQLELVMRTPGEHDETPAGAAAHKAAAALRCGVTHFIESDPVQAIFIAQRAPLLRVIWWNAHTRTGTLIGASAWS
ncbi:phosphoribosyltransferase [Paraburkholderia caballeronis]|uniref:Hypoxanthine phosphoribosyltransferase n=1 Tax=Paraburkholderia caballeronis TaxID=416943 RepID=A0A1H7UHJ0_9BURK|nr:phosphoribosyltransferase [Paraburkholderia caballeronis]PXW17505.1 hypoxanthine phosphoribosyltransferase [Paraburkholderia caballeronis]PXW95094.1 hypoxanthine phosphoribosyltransferase [Paraburkholderia caballeronis]RAJ90940.1 hypoxanthine phosphoribosyltransferase [Paraburkholderia caballeronis]TDV26750.1 hypoxanthine phosphoribosyltransferase [Paraburkholderia caballeronis]SEE18348.1 Hypoxanthine phosphoribosyltransferase [Paraburkholderia caballeronis]